MVTNSIQRKWDQLEEEEGEEEEALSLCDLPITLINIKDQDKDQLRKEDTPQVNETQEEFDFRSWGDDLFSQEPEMCVADDIFFQGQILPWPRFRPKNMLGRSSSSEASLIAKIDDGNQLNHSESLDSVFLSEFQSNSSRSSSVRSQNSSISTSSTTSTTNTTTPRISKPKIRNQFHTHPSPKPQLRISGPRQTSLSNQGRKSKSSAWEFFRLGVVPTPEIGLQDLKVRSSTNSANKNCVSRDFPPQEASTFNVSWSSSTRIASGGGFLLRLTQNKNCVSRNSSNNSSSSNSTTKSVKMSNKTHDHGDKNNHHVFKGGGLLMRGCKCSVESDIVMIKGGTKRTEKKESTQHAMKEKVVELKKQKHRQKQGKKVISRRRTSEWLKELHVCHDSDEEALLSKP